MTSLIVGHVDHQGARIWLKGSTECPFGAVSWKEQGSNNWSKPIQIDLEGRHGFTGMVELANLTSNTAYDCRASCLNSAIKSFHEAALADNAEGTFKTRPVPGSKQAFTFMLGSCNLHSIGLFNSPDDAFSRLSVLAKEHKASFMIHCGDQIYADIPLQPTLDIEYYRAKYKDAWEDSKPTKKFLTELSHYMILDDHEIINNFANQEKYQHLKGIALKVYREFQHLHNPQTYGSSFLHYSFEHGHAHFFVMDTRSERAPNEMIDPEQLAHFKEWLITDSAYKFVVTSVPFVGLVRNGDDRWNGPSYKKQRDEVIDLIFDNLGEKKLIFLTGDMHNAYHAKLELERDGKQIEIHELMSSPINQLGKSKLGRYDTSGTPWTTPNGTKCTSRLKANDFFGDHSNAMVIQVSEDVIIAKVHRTKKQKLEKTWIF